MFKGMPRSRYERKTIAMKVLTARERQLPDGTVFRNVDILLSNGEARRLPLEDFGKKLEGNVGDDVKANEPKCVVAPLKGFSIQTIHINEEKKIVTVVFSDGTKQVVKCSPEDSFDTEIGFALAFARKLFGSKTQVRKYITRNAKVIKAPVIVKPKRGRKPKKVVEQSQKEEN